MEPENSKVTSGSKNVEKIRTKLKFIKSDRNGALISFVSQNTVTNVVCGVRQESPYPKKIVIIDKKIANNIIVNMLYDCVLIPMTSVRNERTGENHTPGFIAIEANPVQFKATVSTKYERGIKYMVEVSFGNKVIRFDPFRGSKESVKSLKACRAILEKRYDVQDLLQVLEDFDIAAGNLLELMKEDKRELNSRKSHAKAGRRYRH